MAVRYNGLGKLSHFEVYRYDKKDHHDPDIIPPSLAVFEPLYAVACLCARRYGVDYAPVMVLTKEEYESIIGRKAEAVGGLPDRSE